MRRHPMPSMSRAPLPIHKQAMYLKKRSPSTLNKEICNSISERSSIAALYSVSSISPSFSVIRLHSCSPLLVPTPRMCVRMPDWIVFSHLTHQSSLHI